MTKTKKFIINSFNSILLLTLSIAFIPMGSVDTEANSGTSLAKLAINTRSWNGSSWASDARYPSSNYGNWDCSSSTFEGVSTQGVEGCANYANVTSANNPLYAYQYRYTYTFPQNRKDDLSNLYRSSTGLNGTYDGIVWTYTYYSYLDTQSNSYIQWENPNSGNSNNGFLIYGIPGSGSGGNTGGGSNNGQTQVSVGDSIEFNCSTPESSLSSAEKVTIGNSTYYVGYRQVTSNNQDPIISKFTNGSQDWCKDNYDGGSAPDSKGLGLMATPNGDLYAVFTVDGGDNNYQFGASGGWLTGYGSGGGAKVSIVSKIDTNAGNATNGTFIRAQLSSGNTNTMSPVNLGWDDSNNRVIFEGASAFSPLKARAYQLWSEANR